MSEATADYLVHLLGFSSFLWIGLYMISRGDGGRVATLTGATALATAGFFLCNGLLSLTTGHAAVTLNRVTWWASVVPATLWLQLSLQLNPRALQAHWYRQLTWLNLGAGLAIVLLGTLTNAIRDYRYTGNPNHAVNTGPLFVIYVIYLFFCAGYATYNLSCIRQSEAQPAASRSEVRLLVIGGLCFLAGAGYLALGELQGGNWLQLPGLLLMVIGLGAVGATVVIRSTLLLGKDVRRDFLYSFAVLMILLVPSTVTIGSLVGFNNGQHGVAMLLLAAIITVGHTLYDKGREWLDTAFFTPQVREERAAARAYADALATPPAGPSPELATQKAFDDAVRKALTHLSDPTKLATSPLLHLRVVSRGVTEGNLEDNRLDRSAVLKEILLELLDGLRPADSAGGVTGDASRFYNCLYYPYVRGLSRRRAPSVLRQLQERRRRDGGPRSDLERVVDWLLQVDEDTFYKWQRRGSDTIAAVLREREAAAGGAVPEAPSGNLAVATTAGYAIP